LRDTVQKTEQRLNDPAREIEEGSVDIAKIRMRHAELHGRVGEGDAAAAALEEEKTEHSDTQRDAMSMLDRARGEQRELVQAHTRAEEQHSMDAQELKRLGAERTAEDRIEKHHQQQRSEDDTSCWSSSTRSWISMPSTSANSTGCALISSALRSKKWKST
jgi:hypothetical protein